jgi:hypothetical protein
MAFVPFLWLISLLEFPLFSLIMRDFATQKLATGNSDSESKGCLRDPVQHS